MEGREWYPVPPIQSSWVDPKASLLDPRSKVVSIVRSCRMGDLSKEDEVRGWRQAVGGGQGKSQPSHSKMLEALLVMAPLLTMGDLEDL